MQQTYSELQAEYGEILNTSIYVEPEPNPSFLEISGFPHYEDVISNWYAFFFDSSERHGLKRLFIDTLVQLINEKRSDANNISVNTCKVIRERYVEGKRIDLLLYDEKYLEKGTEKYKNAIIVENKIYAALYNDLKLYNDNIYADECKVGVVMSLNIVEKGLHANFINITHTQFLNKVLENSGKYIVKANEKYLILLKDFIQQIQSFKLTDNMKDIIKFYFDNAVKINELYTIKNQATDAVVNQLKIAMESTEFRAGRKYPESLNIRYEGNNRILIILKTENIFDKNTYEIQLWITYELAAKWHSEENLKQRVYALPTPQGFSFNNDKAGKQWYFLGTSKAEYSKDFTEIEQLPSNIANYLQNNFKPFIDNVLGLLASK